MDHTLVARPGGASPWGGEPAVRAARSCARSSRRLEEGAALTRCWGNHAAAPQPRRPAVPAESPSPLPRHFLSSRLSRCAAVTSPRSLPVRLYRPHIARSPGSAHPARAGWSSLEPGGLSSPPTTAPTLDRPPRPRGNLDDGLKSGK